MAFEKAMETLKFTYLPFLTLSFHTKTHSLPVPFFHTPSNDNIFVPKVTTLISVAKHRTTDQKSA